METKRLDNAALAAGISPSYINAHGKPQSIAAATKQRLLMRCIVPPPRKRRWIHCRRCRFSPTAKNVAAGGRSRGFSGSSPPKRANSIKATRGGETLPLPARLPEGYHSLTLTQDGERWHCRASSRRAAMNRRR
jgi:4-alpha-glucanotransferase